ncbi:pre-toxin TG domain-containing protein [Thermoactinomyces vulgaris]|jgi:Pre-toxin TG|uniref:Pre-toxin TG domain-containing protein n=1 Tax=Thermoactinomyces vulgaris TaxID=2026 RepID=A0ABS0QII1_THEVU|nr:pre-toxin TG domain-containing protein [Thermoactinomyces vulgaris]MBA4550775.1 pre-toxin TG domain-containing protein [Thermoactinomyces vulgaris]MBA4596166.1 pre-toxin TG domain-containing protein [Thermoactinomyces vulgaris]MBH8588551.1 pre-toxin TG domain-containing protein [Thermoactinomyces vulgaris]RMB02200.1 putative toxin of predicted polymorphic toxin system [Thermoactinomyces vulgaris]
MIKRFCMTLFRLVVCFAVLFMSAGTCYADPSGGFEVPEVNEDFTKVKPNQGAQQKKDENTWLGDFLIWIGAAKDKKDLEKLSKQANDEFLDGFFKKSVESLLGYDLYTGDPLQGERKKEADRALSSVVDCIPVISNIKNLKDLFTGKDSISGDKLSPVDKVISAIGIASGPGKKAGVILKGIFNGGKKLLKKFGVYIDDLAERFGFGPKLQPAGGPPDIPRRPEVNRIEGTNGGGKNQKNHPVKRTQEEYDDLARDPSHGGQITEQGIKEREIGLALESQGKLGKIIRDPQSDGGAEFIDTTTGIKWDIKSFVSYPNGHTSPRKGAFTVEKAMKKINAEFRRGHNVIIDKRDLIPQHVKELEDAIKKNGVEDRIIWYP